MSVVFHLLFPVCSTVKEGVSKKEERFSSASIHFVTSLAVAIVIAIGASLAAYFLTHGVIKWTAIAGGCAASVSGIITYLILRCMFGRISQGNPVISTDSISNRAEGRSKIQKTKDKTSNKQNLFPKWLSKLLPPNLACISFEVGEKIYFESLRAKLTTPIAFLEGKTSAIVLDLLVKHIDHDPSYIPGGRTLEADIPSSSEFRMMIVVANNAGKGKWRLIPEEMDIRHRTKIYPTGHIFPAHRGQIIYFFDSATSLKVNIDQEEEPEDNKLQWLLSKLLTNQTVKIPEFATGLVADTSKRVGAWEVSLISSTTTGQVPPLSGSVNDQVVQIIFRNGWATSWPCQGICVIIFRDGTSVKTSINSYEAKALLEAVGHDKCSYYTGGGHPVDKLKHYKLTEHDISMEQFLERAKSHRKKHSKKVFESLDIDLY